MTAESSKTKTRPAWAVRIAAARTLSGMTQAQMAKHLGVSQQAYAGYEGGKREPNFRTLCEISNLLDLSLDFILTGKQENKTRQLKVLSN